MAVYNEASDKNKHQYKANYYYNRHCYVDDEGNYVYEIWDENTKSYVKGDVLDKDVYYEWVIYLDKTDHDEDLQAYYDIENMDHKMEAQRQNFEFNSSRTDYDDDPFEQIPAKGVSLEESIFKEEEHEDPRVSELLEYMQQLTSDQVGLIYALFGEQKKLSEIAEEIVKADGTHPTPQAIKSCENKIISKLRKLFGID